MDEHEFAELFRAAVRDTPPASFDERDVVIASRRIARRRRSAAVTGAAIGAVLLLGGVLVGVGLVGGPQSTTSVAAGSAAARDPAKQGAGDTRPLTADDAPSDQPSGAVRPHDIGGGCGPVDGELAGALAGELRAAALTQPVPVTASCPTGSRAAGYVVHDGAAIGVFSVVLAPSDGPSSAAGGAPLGTRSSSIITSTGKRLTVLSAPAPESTTAPFAGEVEAVAQHLASRF